MMQDWKPIDTAPKDGTWIKVRGRDWGKATGRRHYAIALYEDGNWHEVGSGGGLLQYLTDWKPLLPTDTTGRVCRCSENA